MAPWSIIWPHPGYLVLFTTSKTIWGEIYLDRDSNIYFVPKIPVVKWPDGPEFKALIRESFANSISSSGIISWYSNEENNVCLLISPRTGWSQNLVFTISSSFLDNLSYFSSLELFPTNFEKSFIILADWR